MRDQSGIWEEQNQLPVSPRRCMVFLVVVVLGLGLFVPAVSGHAFLSESSPGEGEQLEDLPAEIELVYTGDGIQTADVDVMGSGGTDVSDEATIDPDDRRTVTVPLADDGDGLYVVEWEVLADDGHTTTGTFFFSVGDEAPDRDAILEIHDDEDDEDFSWFESAAKGLVLLSLIGLVGVPVTMWASVYPALARTNVSRSVPETNARRLLAVSSCLLFVGVLSLGLVQGYEDGAVSMAAFETYLGTSLGTVWLVQVGLAIGLVSGLLAIGRLSVPRRVWLPGTAFGGLLIAFSVSWTSHSATMIGRVQGVVTDFGHIGGAALWVGGLLTLALVVPSVLTRTDEDRRRAVAATAISRFSVVALVGVTLAVASGLLLAAWHVPDLQSLRETLYGTALSAKTSLVLLALGVGGFTRFVLLERLRSVSTGTDPNDAADRTEPKPVQTFVRGVRFELGVLILVIVLSGLLTTAPTAALAGGEDGPERATIEREGDNVDLELSVVPAENVSGLIQVDENEPVVFDVTFDAAGENADNRTNLPVEDPSLSLHHDEQTLEINLEDAGNGTYSAVQPLPDRFDWELRVDAWVDGTYVTEWFDLYAVPDADGGAHDHHGDDDHSDHDGDGAHESHDHAEESHNEHADDAGPFALLLQFGAVAVAVIGTVAVSIEAVRFNGDDERDRST